MIETLLFPFQFPFMQNAFLICILISIPTALLSCFLVMKGWALMGDAVSHAVLPGIVLAYIMGIPLIIGAFAAGMFCAVATGYVATNSRVKPDTVMGVIFSGMFGIGIVLYVSVETDAHLDHILFGNMLAVVVCMVSMLAGTYASFFLDSAPAPTIILIMTLVFIVAFACRLMLTRRATLA